MDEVIKAPVTDIGIMLGICIGLIVFCILTTCLLINLMYSKKYKVDTSISLILMTIIIVLSSFIGMYFFNKF